ncbi:hypothetical protein [Massilia varians]|uniref:hypothetical protein n=1 Tax=Massilia varians TaxID=457921 RepID=UPI00255346C3|nr:hypothetical protein [Massilia varians]MDK6078650.1 hypothetical protein [Massilia varians]
MALGSIQNLVMCVPVAEVTSPQQQAVCPVVNGQNYAPANMQAYVIDPSQQNNLEAAVGPFDYSYASGVWALGFTMVVGLYAVSLGIGHALGMIRRG